MKIARYGKKSRQIRTLQSKNHHFLFRLNIKNLGHFKTFAYLQNMLIFFILKIHTSRNKGLK
jgi:hypothetical protein